MGFRITPAEEVRYSALNSEIGNIPQNVFQTMLDMFFADVTVVGEAPDDYRCLDTLYFDKPYSGYEFERWMGRIKVCLN